MTSPYAFYNADDPARRASTDMSDAATTTARWLNAGELPDGLAIELGCGRGVLASVSDRYTGFDLSFRALAAAAHVRRRVCGDMERLPFRDGSVAFVFSWAAIEHVPNPERVLAEVERVLRRRGVAVLAPAWHCRPWAAEGLEFRPYRQLRPGQRVRKALIPLRNSVAWRALPELGRRALREIRMRRRAPLPFEYRRLQPSLAAYFGTDSDAYTDMDPHAMAVYFASRGWDVLSHPTRRARMAARHEPVVVRKP